MEPMTLGSPGASPANNSNSYLPPFLMGESNPSSMPRNNTLSPTKGRALAFGPQSPGMMASSPEMNRSNMHQRSFLNYQESPHQQQHHQPHAFSSPNPNANKSISGPPTQGLFETLQSEKLALQQTPTSKFYPSGAQQMQSPHVNQSYIFNQSLNESAYMNHSNFLNQSNYIGSPRSSHPNEPGFRNPNNNTFHNTSIYNQSMNGIPPSESDFWITVYGFPPTSAPMIITHFSQCGNIVDKSFPPQNGNWIHLRFSSRLECDKALNYNEKILSNNLMIGVSRCKDPCIVGGGKENNEFNE